LFSVYRQKTTKKPPLVSSLENSSHEGLLAQLVRGGREGTTIGIYRGKVSSVFDKAKKRLSLE